MISPGRQRRAVVAGDDADVVLLRADHDGLKAADLFEARLPALERAAVLSQVIDTVLRNHVELRQVDGVHALRAGSAAADPSGRRSCRNCSAS